MRYSHLRSDLPFMVALSFYGIFRTFQLEVCHLLKCREELDLLANEVGES